MQISNDTRSHYERIGGEAKVRQLVQRFYQLMDELPEAQRLRKMHHISLKSAEDKLFMFLSGWMGGPQLFVEKFGHPQVAPAPHAVRHRRCRARPVDAVHDAGAAGGGGG